MPKAKILHMFSPLDNVSPFDVNMAADAGYEIIVPYTGVDADAVGGLVQDAIFSRPPGRFNRTGAFIGGYDVDLAAEMLARARDAQVPPFEISLFADPNGAYTTSGAMVALAEKHLKTSTGAGFQGRKVAVLGCGPVGLCAAVLAEQLGGDVCLVHLTNSPRGAVVGKLRERYSVAIPKVDGQTDELKADVLGDMEVVLCAAKAGIQILSSELLREIPKLLVAADVNAVPPAGIEGIEPNHDGVALQTTGDRGALGVGALAIGRVKYDTQQGLFVRMLDTDQPLCLDFPDAYRLAAKLV